MARRLQQRELGGEVGIAASRHRMRRRKKDDGDFPSLTTPQRWFGGKHSVRRASVTGDYLVGVEDESHAAVLAEGEISGKA